MIVRNLRWKWAPSVKKPLALGSSQAGMTIIEILIVIALIGTIMTLVMSNVLNKSDEAKVDLAVIHQKKLGESLKLYRLDNNRYPSTAESLKALLQKPDRAGPWRGPYTEPDRLTDPWGQEFRYESRDSRSFAIFSAGPDGVFESSDDIRFPDDIAESPTPETFELIVPKATPETEPPTP